jgi:xylulokinase
MFGEGMGFEALSALAGEVPPASGGLIFLPYLNGERSPIWDADAKGVYYGLSFLHTKGHFVRATMEGTAFALRHNLEAAAQAGPAAQVAPDAQAAPAAQVAPAAQAAPVMHAVGGACNSRPWMQLKADITKTTIKTVEGSDHATAKAAALIAGVGAGYYKDFTQAVRASVRFVDEYVPNPANYEAYDRAYMKYRAIYENLKGVMKQ